MELSKQIMGYSRSKVQKELSSLEATLKETKETLQRQKESNQDLKRELQYFKSRATMFTPIFHQSTELSEGVITQGEADAEALLATTRHDLMVKKAAQTVDDNELKAKKQMILEQEFIIKNDTRERLIQWLENIRMLDDRFFASNVSTATDVMAELEQGLTNLARGLEKDKAQVQMVGQEGASVPEYLI